MGRRWLAGWMRRGTANTRWRGGGAVTVVVVVVVVNKVLVLKEDKGEHKITQRKNKQ